MGRTTWRELISAERANQNDTTPLLWTLTDEELDEPFDAGHGVSRGKAFTGWSETRVYFPAVYDGAEWCDSVPRNPCDEATKHIGGE